MEINCNTDKWLTLVILGLITEKRGAPFHTKGPES